ncbi:helix-turn-helix transcriptional regulator [Streptomyces uncialis]|uniref:helix-turn-helix transcriptional regulator n=1 Tax=Streptomyces uncialis TaxID=1048205 RepID=UPI002258954A|nr:helix-turn-helix transcriptional regulator [Streptomyces uncialis]MCX4664895.1 helix-turn-helix transcriptional regulator [Streptomyces uncialis]
MASKRVRLSQRRKSAGFTQESLAARLGVERTTVIRWETAVTEPQPPIRPKLARLLAVTGDELQALLDDIVIVGGPDPSERIAYAIERPSSVDLIAVAYLHERIRHLDESYDKAPSTGLLGPAGQLHGQVSYLRQHAGNPRVRRALLGAEAESATLMGQLVWDVSQRRDHAGSAYYLDAAIHAARQVRDPNAEAHAVLRKSFVALYGERNPGKGLVLAQEAAAVAQLGSPSLLGLSLLHIAEGQAMAGDAKGCEDSFRKARAQFDRVNEDDLAADRYTVNEFNRLRGSCYLHLNLPDRAEPILSATVTALTAKRKSQSIALGNLTLALIRQRKLEEAAASLHRTIDAVELTRGGGGLNLAFTAGRELREWRSEPWVHDINDRLLALMTAS